MSTDEITSKCDRKCISLAFSEIHLLHYPLLIHVIIDTDVYIYNKTLIAM